MSTYALHSALSSCTHERGCRHAEAGRILVQELHDVPEAVQAALHALSIAEAQSCTKLCQATVRTSILGPQLSTYLISESHVPNLRLFTCLRMMAEGGQGKKQVRPKGTSGALLELGPSSGKVPGCYLRMTSSWKTQIPFAHTCAHHRELSWEHI